MTASKSNGAVIGVVADLNDPDRLGRVRVKFPHLRGSLSDWARVVTPMAGQGRGFYWRPEKGDEMLVLFEHGDPTRPYVLGGLWSTSQKPPADDGKHPDNNWRFIRSRSGHVIKMDDTPGKERIEIVDKDGARKIVIDSSGSKMQVQSDRGDIEVIAGGGNVKVTCNQGNVEVKAGAGNIALEAMNVQVKASGTLSLEATGALTIKGATVAIN